MEIQSNTGIAARDLGKQIARSLTLCLRSCKNRC